MTPLTDDERAQLICDVGCPAEVHREYCAASIPNVYSVEIDAPELVARVESILLARETALRETIAQEIEGAPDPSMIIGHRDQWSVWRSGVEASARIVRGGQV